MFKRLSVGALALVLAACIAPKPRHPIPQVPGELAPPPGLAVPGRAFRIDENQSELRILVYRAGPLARLGHNHVMVNRAIHGTVLLADAKGASSFQLKVPAAAFVVDELQARRDEGADFAAEISDDARSGTLHNMLSTAVLDADEFPEITVDCVAAPDAQDLPGGAPLTASVEVSVAGHVSTFDVPVTLEVDPNRLSATGSLELRQSALGLTPYSLMLGALQVQDALKIKFDIVAVQG